MAYAEREPHQQFHGSGLFNRCKCCPTNIAALQQAKKVETATVQLGEARLAHAAASFLLHLLLPSVFVTVNLNP